MRSSGESRSSPRVENACSLALSRIAAWYPSIIPAASRFSAGDIRRRERRNSAIDRSRRFVRISRVTASNRAGMLYLLPGCDLEARELVERLDDEPAVEAALFLEGAEAVVRREGTELRFAPGPG